MTSNRRPESDRDPLKAAVEKEYLAASVNESLLDAISHAGIAVEWIDCQTGRFIKVNQHAANLHEMPLEEIEGKHLWDLDPQMQPEEFRSLVDRLRSEKRLSLESVHIRKTGEVFPVEVSISYRGEQDDQPEHFLAFVKDISERKRQQVELEVALENAESASLAKSEFLANMSHEIRTPMNGVYGSLQLLARKCHDPELIELIQRASLSCRSLLTIVNDILDYSKIEANMLTIEEMPFLFDEVVQLVVTELSQTAEQKRVLLQVNYDWGYEDGWLGDPVRVKQILVNLLSNAIKFSEGGKVTIHIRECANDQGEACLAFGVEDTGIGLSEAELEKIFARFEQADNSTTRKYGGTGLGLAITQALIEKMQGQLNVQSEQGKGSFFRVRIPLSKIRVDRVTQDESASKNLPDLHDVRVLLAEDVELNQLLFEDMLEPTFATLEIASDGKEAVELAQRFSPNVIFMDIQMPVMDGIEACRHIKEDYPDVPVIALTANVMKDDVDQYMAAGFDGHLGKPLEIDELYDMLTRHLQDGARS